MNARILIAATLTFSLLPIAYLAAARWLQQRSAWLTHHAEVDAVYVLAGPSSRPERIDALLEWIRKYDCNLCAILLPEDRVSGLRRDNNGNLVPVARWQLEHLQAQHAATPSLKSSQIAGHTIIIVPGHYHGTDGEMQALARFLETQPRYRRVALVTSRSHIRRALQRARSHIDNPRIIGVVPAGSTPQDYLPRRVLSEYLQILRDKLGLTHAPFLHRGWWKRHAAPQCAFKGE